MPPPWGHCPPARCHWTTSAPRMGSGTGGAVQPRWTGPPFRWCVYHCSRMWVQAGECGGHFFCTVFPQMEGSPFPSAHGEGKSTGIPFSPCLALAHGNEQVKHTDETVMPSSLMHAPRRSHLGLTRVWRGAGQPCLCPAKHVLESIISPEPKPSIYDPGILWPQKFIGPWETSC